MWVYISIKWESYCDHFKFFNVFMNSTRNKTKHKNELDQWSIKCRSN